MIDYRQAQDILIKHARSFGMEQVGIGSASGRVLAEEILADRDYPPFNRATMDGYAIRYRDWEQGIRHFKVVETIFAGSAHTQSIGAGECYKIMTGAPVPDEANLVVRREDTEEGDRVIGIRLANDEQPSTPERSVVDGQPVNELRPYLNIARKGEDMRASDLIISLPCICEPVIMGLLASLGKSEVRVAQLPRVSLLTTGNEVVAVDEPVNDIQIRNSNLWLLRSTLQKWGIGIFSHQHVQDDKLLLRDAMERALSSDIIILSGGVSAGDADYVPGVLKEAGVEKLFHKVAMKPGKPVWCGIGSNGSMVFALPGNPFSCLVGFELLIKSWLYACFGISPPAPLELPLKRARKKKTPLDEFFPVRLTGSPTGVLPVAINGSGDIRMGLHAHALALHAAISGNLAEGDLVLCYPL